MRVLVVDLPTVEPVQQGSKTMIGVGKPCFKCKRKKMIMVDAADVSNKTNRDRLKKYRRRVALEAEKSAKLVGWEKLEGGVDLSIWLIYRRPESHLKVSGALRKGKPIHKVSKPDLDKLLRAINDGLAMAGVFGDDSQVVNVAIRKRYARATEIHGVKITARATPTGLAGLLLEGGLL